MDWYERENSNVESKQQDWFENERKQNDCEDGLERGKEKRREKRDGSICVEKKGSQLKRQWRLWETLTVSREREYVCCFMEEISILAWLFVNEWEGLAVKEEALNHPIYYWQAASKAWVYNPSPMEAPTQV